jgi:hypothetical protein
VIKQRHLSGDCDFSKIEGLDGIYIANQFIDADNDGLHNDIATVITFDKGGKWNRIPAPESERHLCADPQRCYLNLHGGSTSFEGKFFSQKSAIGVVLGTGNIGYKLDVSDAATNTYLSLDGGATWKLFRAGSFDYQVSAFGGLVVLAPNSGGTNELWFTTNGQNFTGCRMTMGVCTSQT